MKGDPHAGDERQRRDLATAAVRAPFAPERLTNVSRAACPLRPPQSRPACSSEEQSSEQALKDHGQRGRIYRSSNSYLRLR